MGAIMNGGRNARFSIYDKMELQGAFADNVANVGARDKEGRPIYAGPVNYPKMYYHPLAEERVTAPGIPQHTAFGAIMTNVHKEIIDRVVNSEAEEAEAIEEGWHDHPAKAIAAAIAAGVRKGVAPPISSGARIESLEKEIERLTRELAASKTASPKAEAKSKSPLGA